MSPSLRALLAGAIDYAGMFPPAKVPLEEAFRNYIGYRESPDAWMLGRFVCPAQQLREVTNVLKGFSSVQPVAISMLGDVDADPQKFRTTVSNQAHPTNAYFVSWRPRILSLKNA
jgi:hypothetical protein